MPCPACPFSCSDLAEQGINRGCLPAPYEVLEIKKSTGLNWGCHDKPGQMCAGYVAAAAETGLDYKTGGVLPYADWYHHGVEGAGRG